MVKNVFFLIFSRMKMQIMHKKVLDPHLKWFSSLPVAQNVDDGEEGG